MSINFITAEFTISSVSVQMQCTLEIRPLKPVDSHLHYYQQQIYGISRSVDLLVDQQIHTYIHTYIHIYIHTYLQSSMIQSRYIVCSRATVNKRPIFSIRSIFDKFFISSKDKHFLCNITLNIKIFKVIFPIEVNL